MFKSDLNGMIAYFKQIGTNSKWNLLKNLVYFSFKFALFHMFDLNDKIAKASYLYLFINTLKILIKFKTRNINKFFL